MNLNSNSALSRNILTEISPNHRFVRNIQFLPAYSSDDRRSTIESGYDDSVFNVSRGRAEAEDSDSESGDKEARVIGAG
ncbi:MAG TPA: hypothetical protein PK404_03595 [Fervidobacterium sp.]|nr:hypothetical protein [Fervidobacterium sp.]